MIEIQKKVIFVCFKPVSLEHALDRIIDAPVIISKQTF